MEEVIKLQGLLEAEFASKGEFEGRPCLSTSSDHEVASINQLLTRRTWRSIAAGFPDEWEEIDPHGLVAMLSDEAFAFFLPALILIGFGASWRSKAVLAGVLFRLGNLVKINRIGNLDLTNSQLNLIFSTLKYLFRGDEVSLHSLDKIIKKISL